MNDRIETTGGDAAVVFLRQVAELIGIDNLPAPIAVTVWNRSVLVGAADFPAWCDALGVAIPDFVPGEHTAKTEFAQVEVLGFTLEANRPATRAVA